MGLPELTPAWRMALLGAASVSRHLELVTGQDVETVSCSGHSRGQVVLKQDAVSQTLRTPLLRQMYPLCRTASSKLTSEWTYMDYRNMLRSFLVRGANARCASLFWILHRGMF